MSSPTPFRLISLPLLLALLSAIFDVACTNSVPGLKVSSRLIRPELSIGEYIQLENAENLLTFVRDESALPRGLVRIKVDNNELEALDANAIDGKDLRVRDDWVIYRRGAQGLLFNGSIPIAFTDGLEKIRSIYPHGNVVKVFVDFLDRKSGVLTINREGEVLHQAFLSSSARHVFLYLDEVKILSQSAEGISISSFDLETDSLSKSQLIEAGDVGAYTAIEVLGEKIFIAYMDMENGLLKMATHLPTETGFTITTIDGNPNRTMRGMDIAFFGDHQNLGLIYLDAWALKLRMARLKNGQWTSEQLPIGGSVGFYNQVLKVTPRRLIFASHHFRTEHQSLQATFEDLVIHEVDLQ